MRAVSNAIKFTSHGEVIVAVTSTPDGQDEWITRFEVTDTGIGVKPDEIPRLFESFSQADSSTTRRYGGTGLGPAISKHLSQLMGGEIGAATRTAGSGHARPPLRQRPVKTAPSMETRRYWCNLRWSDRFDQRRVDAALC